VRTAPRRPLCAGRRALPAATEKTPITSGRAGGTGRSAESRCTYISSPGASHAYPQRHLGFTLLPASLLGVAAGTAPDCDVLSAGATLASSDDVLGCTFASYLSCEDAIDGPAAGKLQDPTGNVPLDFSPPTASFTTGAGCGEAEAAQVTGTAMTNIYDLNVAGLVMGNVDSVTFELHSIYAAAARASGTMNLDVRFDIGGISPNGTVDNVASGTGTITKTPKPIRFAVDPATSSTGLSESLTFTLTDLFAKYPELSAIGDGSGQYHQINVTVSINQTDYAGAYVWGATEIPASITINAPAAKQGKIISAKTLVG
jgi:hypothetical protein